MKYYPVYIDITNERCVVVGGGDVAERKVMRLIDSGAHVSVVSRTLTSTLEKMKKEGKIDHIEADYDDDSLSGAFLVIGATDRDDVNAKIFRDGRAKGCLVNIVDDPDNCNVILPSLFRRGDLSIAISTGGKSPALAKKLRQDMEHLFGPEYETLLMIMGKLREKIVMKGRSSNENRQLFESVIHSDILHHIKEKKWKQVKKIIRDITGEDIEVDE